MEVGGESIARFPRNGGGNGVPWKPLERASADLKSFIFGCVGSRPTGATGILRAIATKNGEHLSLRVQPNLVAVAKVIFPLRMLRPVAAWSARLGARRHGGSGRPSRYAACIAIAAARSVVSSRPISSATASATTFRPPVTDASRSDCGMGCDILVAGRTARD